MIKTLSYSEVEKFHKDIAKQMLSELRNSDSEVGQTPIENIKWAYSFETIDNYVDIRRKRKDIDRSIRREKLLKLDNKLKPKRKTSIFSFLKKEENEVISDELKDFFKSVVAISLMIKVGDYERFESVEKTSLFESKVKEELGNFKF